MNPARCTAAGALLLATAAAQQGDPAALVAALAGADELAVESAMRELCALPKTGAPLALLHGAARQERSHEPAMLVLAWFAAVEPDDVLPADRSHPLLAAPALGCLPETGLRALLRDAATEGPVRRTALEILQDRSLLTAADLVAAIESGDESLMRTALYVLRWEWPLVPPEVLAAVRARPESRLCLLQLLADAPRPGCAAWARECADDGGLAAAERLFALAAIGSGLDLAQGRFALRTAAEHDNAQVSLAFRCAMDRLPAKVAAELVGEAHRLCAQGTAALTLMPFFEQLDQDGEVRLLGLAAALPPQAQEQLTWFLSRRNSQGYVERVRAALDGEIPLEPHLLPREPTLLDRPGRIERVLALLNAEAADPAARRHAFELLVAAAAPVARLLPYVRARDDDCQVQLFRYYPAALPADVLQEALDRPLARAAAFAAMEQHGAPRALEPFLLKVVEDHTGLEAVSAARVLALAGSEEAATLLWRTVRDRPGLRDQVLDFFGVGRRPWAHELLLGELARKDPPEDCGEEALQSMRARVRAILVELGDRRELRELLASADKIGAHWLRRVRTAVPDLTVEQAHRLLPLLDRVHDPEVAIEIVLWLSRSSDARVQQRLQELSRTAGEPELEEETLRALMAGPARATLLAELDAAVQKGPLDGRAELLTYAAVDPVPGERPSAADLERWARLYLQAPLQTPAAELARTLRFPDGRVGYPMAKGIAQALRRDPMVAAGPVFRRMAEAVAADPRMRFLGRQRLLCLWQAAVAQPDMQRTLGRATAALLLQIPDPRRPGEALGHLLAGEDAAVRGGFQPAAEHFLSAVRGLLRGGGAGMAVRVVLGDRDAAAFSDPQAALAAAPWLCRARALVARGDHASAARELNAAFELGWSDAATRKTVSAMMEQLR